MGKMSRHILEKDNLEKYQDILNDVFKEHAYYTIFNINRLIFYSDKVTPTVYLLEVIYPNNNYSAVDSSAIFFKDEETKKRKSYIRHSKSIINDRCYGLLDSIKRDYTLNKLL